MCSSQALSEIRTKRRPATFGLNLVAKTVLVLISWSAVASSAGIGVAPAAESASRAVAYPDAAMFRHRLQQPDRLITPSAGTNADSDDDLRVSFDRVRRAAARQKTSGKRQPRNRGYSAVMDTRIDDICGRSTKGDDLVPSFRILNGSCAEYGQFPWVAQIQARSSGNNYDHHCGGTIIAEDIILTAAHCLQNHNHEHLRVVVGQHDLKNMDSEEMTFDIEKTIMHENWDSKRDGKYSNDIALIKLRRKGDGSGIVFSPRVGPACMPRGDVSSAGQCIIAGWGKTIDHDVSEDCLQHTSVPIISNRECREMYSSSDKKITDGMTCAGYRSGGVDTCKGDSGGPLACMVDGRYHVFGVVSWGEGCGKEEKPGVYTRVHGYVDWIESTIQKLSG